MQRRGGSIAAHCMVPLRRKGIIVAKPPLHRWSSCHRGSTTTLIVVGFVSLARTYITTKNPNVEAMPGDDVPDSTDWLSTPLSGLASVEAAIRCQVCKDFYKTPMITSCSHTFCSLCIRRALSNDGKCPLCRAPEQELKLRCNWSVEEAAEAFSRAREAILGFARSIPSRERSPKRKADDQASPATHDLPEPKRIRTSARLNKNRTDHVTVAPQASNDAPEEVIQASDDEDEDEYIPDDPDGLVPCPVCDKKMKAWQVFQHLETCPGPSPVATNSSSLSSFGHRPQRQHKAIERLPALNYSMLKENALRKKMNELGLSSQGPRILLEKRHREWLTLWNANCDAAHPKKRSELLQDMEIWERTQGGRAPTSSKALQAAAAIKDKDFDGAAWAAKHDSSFKDLIASARKSRAGATKAHDDDEPPDKAMSIRTESPEQRVPVYQEGQNTASLADKLQDPRFADAPSQSEFKGPPNGNDVIHQGNSESHHNAKVAGVSSPSLGTVAAPESRRHDLGAV
ncbi:RING-type E3 ubiquitin transferase [Purpureocillium takamizusanense]|uniref:Postreplication repair E3 ubiquitin-protein ligase RAD18 n=1 Tax=Purpureocillium takamizusanense TaxID=2060973 RepID=A0A9Q8QIG0_9HYPO|nr:RING-type E3 ubiquitin transferase [Purpureocillium takamizusanense]UNI20398.1 RING-type E3 ubiquitin transferase [Purpureocillium takamizusanense]